MRINKYLATVGVASRRSSEEFIKKGQIKVNGKIVTDLAFQVNENSDVVEFNGKVLSFKPEYVYYKLNKPKGYICTSKDDRNRKTILDLFDGDKRLFSVGRLDYDTEGLLIVTNDGDFAQKLIHPSSHIEKEYHCTIEGAIKESELAVMRAGVVKDGERMPKCKVKVLSTELIEKGKVKSTKLSVVINEGKNRQIRKMFEAIGKNIKLLKRVRIADIHLGGLSRGEYKPLTQGELECIGFGK